jgi:hypothetical protein
MVVTLDIVIIGCQWLLTAMMEEKAGNNLY